MKLSKKAQEKIIEIIDTYESRVRFEEYLHETAVKSDDKADWVAYAKFCDMNKKFIDEVKEFLAGDL